MKTTTYVFLIAVALGQSQAAALPAASPESSSTPSIDVDNYPNIAPTPTKLAISARDDSLENLDDYPNIAPSSTKSARAILGLSPDKTKRNDYTPVALSEVDKYIAENGITVTPRTEDGPQARNPADYTPVPASEVDKYISEQGIDLSTRSDAELQTRNDLGSLAARSPKKAGSEDNEDISKRNVNTCLACMGMCGLTQVGINLLSIYQQIGFCLSNCVAQGACNTNDRTKYQDSVYSDAFPAPAPPGGYNYRSW